MYDHTFFELFFSITKQLGIDCEMVGVGIDGKDSMLARVSIVNSFGDTVYDTFVAPMQDVVDYRTEFSGVRPQNLINGEYWNCTDGTSNDNHCVLFIPSQKLQF